MYFGVSDGARAITGNNSGFVDKLKEFMPHVKCIVFFTDMYLPQKKC